MKETTSIVNTPLQPTDQKQQRSVKSSSAKVIKSTARAPIKLLRSISSGVKKSAKLVRVTGKRKGTRHSSRSSRVPSRRSRTSRSLPDDNGGENLSLLSPPARNSIVRSIGSTQKSYEDNDEAVIMNHDDVQARVLNVAESVLRKALILIGAYMLGFNQAIDLALVWNAAYFIGVAWGTCAIIIVLSWFESMRTERNRRHQVDMTVHEQEHEQEVLSNELISVEEDIMNLDDSLHSQYAHRSLMKQEVYDVDQGLRSQSSPEKNKRRKEPRVFGRRRKRKDIAEKFNFDSEDSRDDKYNAMENDSDGGEGDDDVGGIPEETINNEISQEKMQIPPQEHPELEDLFLIDLLTGDRIPANGEPMPFENEMFKGHMLFLSRTTDADSKIEPTHTQGTALNDSRSNYFRSKQRRFEIQVQCKFKKVPPSQMYFHCQLQKPMKMGVVQRAFVGATLNFVKKKNRGAFIFNVPGKEPNAEELREGRYEKPHLTFALEKVFDRVTRTLEGETPPTLGTTIYEDPEMIKKRQNGEHFEYNTTDTFTFALWSAYVDWAQWKCVNLPAVRPFSISSVNKDQDLSMHLYYLNDGETRHFECNQNRILSMELSNARYCKVSEARKRLIQRYSNPERQLGTQGSFSPTEQQMYQIQSTFSDDMANDEMSSGSDGGSGSDDDDEEIPALHDNEDETLALEELGEGIYLKSGDPIVLREANTDEESSALTIGGGFATLQVGNAAKIVIEKVIRKVRRKSGGESRTSQQSSLMRNGDTVRIKVIDSSEVTSYLSIHKGWWLKWIHSARYSALFTIHTNDVEGDTDEIMSHTSANRAGVETQSSYLRFGGTFHLQCAKKGLEVGVRVHNSAKYGGRVLGLYKRNSHYVTEFDQETNKDVDGSRRQMMMPLRFCADELPTSPVGLANADSSPPRLLLSLTEPIEEFRIDTPAWLEIMHRSKRQVVRVYALRMMKDSAHTEEEDEFKISLRLRKGKDLTPLLRLGIATPSQSFDHDENSYGSIPYDLSVEEPRSPVDMNLKIPNDMGKSDSDSSIEDEAGYGDDNYVIDHDAIDLSAHSEDVEDVMNEMTPSSKVGERRRKKKWMKNTTHGITKVAKGVKTGTIKSGTFIGKAVTYPIKGHGRKQKRKYLKEKHSKKTRGKSKSKDHHIAVNKAIRNMRTPSGASNSIMAGQLQAPDQSCRTVSNILSRLSSSPSIEAAKLLEFHLSSTTDLDASFLSGGTAELGVVLEHANYCVPVAEYIVARALWESHWREEACIVYKSSIDFYLPLTNKSYFSVPFYDIQRVRRVDERSDANPLAGCPLLAIETTWKCYYLAFRTEDTRTDFFNVINAAIFSGDDIRKEEELNAHMWQDVQYSAGLSGESAKWANIVSYKKSKQRVILNSRRMSFDCESFEYDEENSEETLCSFVENLLRKALSFSLESLVNDPSDFKRFLDDASRLREFPLSKIDKSESGAFCISVNLYHCLLKHALLLHKTGPPTKKNIVNFMRTHCYEIGGDVFSLAELHCCVLRGNMDLPHHPKPPYVQAPRKSRGHHAYALDYVDRRIIFVVNDLCISPEVAILNPTHLEEQLVTASKTYLKNRIKIDQSRKTVTIPKVFDIYRNDFDGAKTILQYCVQFVNESSRAALLEILENDVFTVKYDNSFDQFYADLRPIGFPVASIP